MQQQGPGGYPNPNFYGGPPPPPPPPATMAPAGAFELLIFRDGHNTQVVKASDRPDALLVITLPVFEKPELTARRGHSSGEKIGTARLHDFTTSKADMTLWGRHERWKKEYDSFTGLGHLSWEPCGDKGLLLEQNGRMLARYSLNGDSQSSLKNKFSGLLTIGRQLAGSGSGSSSDQRDNEADARLTIYAQGLSREQLEEIVFSCAVERERVKKNKTNKRDEEIFSNILEASWA